MKKIIAIIVFSVISSFAFAEHTINTSIVSMFGLIPHTVGQSTYMGVKFDCGISAEYLYVFKNRFAVGGNIIFSYDIFSNSTTVNNITATTTSTGYGFSISPAIGATRKWDVLYVQVVLYPIIFESSSYKNHTFSINQTSKSYTEDVNYKSLKSGILSSIEWGWEHIKLGFGIGTNFIFADTYEDKNNFKSMFGVEGVGTSTFTYIF